MHYPLTLKKISVQLPEKTLHLMRFAPAKRPEIYLLDLVTMEKDTDSPKSVPGDYEEKAQVTIN